MHGLTGTWGLVWNKPLRGALQYEGTINTHFAHLTMGIMPTQPVTASNLRQSIDVERGTWVDAVQIYDQESGFRGSWTVSGNVRLLGDDFPLPLEVRYTTGHLAWQEGTVPRWMREFTDREYDMTEKCGKAWVVSLTETHRLDRDKAGSEAYLQRL